MTTDESQLVPLVVTRVPAPPPPSGDSADYADSFALRLVDAEDHTPEEWARAGLEQAPVWMRCAILVAHRGLLQFRAAPAGVPQVLGWRVTSVTPDEIRLDTTGPLAAATILAQRRTPTVCSLTTYLRYRHPSARYVWRVLGPVHRAFAPRLLAGAARRFGHSATAARARPLVDLPSTGS